ncbi:MAG: GntR family transcriptional regulator [Saprospiraceae bacterium]|nr:GntR family transcriptional regulator [Saprospiraceae bacterium]
MAELGKYNDLEIVRKVDFGFYLNAGDLGEILMPKRYITPDMNIGDTVRVFVYLDGEERPVATTDEVLGQVGEFAYLKVKKVENIGAFLEWGVLKDILVPFSEQKITMVEGRSYLVYIYLDKITERVTATMKLEKFLDKSTPEYEPSEEVDLLIWTPTDIGYKAIINQKHLGVLYKNEVFTKLQTGQKIKGYIRKIREDNKIDLVLDKPGYGKMDAVSSAVLEKVRKSGGFMPFHDKSSPEAVYNHFGISKKVFKQALGNLYKAKLIEMTDAGIRISDTSKTDE